MDISSQVMCVGSLKFSQRDIMRGAEEEREREQRNKTINFDRARDLVLLGGFLTISLIRRLTAAVPPASASVGKTTTTVTLAFLGKKGFCEKERETTEFLGGGGPDRAGSEQ